MKKTKIEITNLEMELLIEGLKEFKETLNQPITDLNQ